VTPPLNSVLFFGPSGCGKTHASLAVAHHTDALLFDISPKNLEGKYVSREERIRLINMVWRTAKSFQPAVIYFDNAEQVYTAKVKGAVKNKSAELMKKQLSKVKEAITPEHRILIIGNTNKPQHLSPELFDKCLYFGFPSFSDRFRIIKSEINKRIGKEYDFEFDVLAHATKDGFSTEAIISSIDYVLSQQRLDRIKFFPLKISEFIPILAKHPVMYNTEFPVEQVNFTLNLGSSL
jgi:SpoVK/Ycf46/Vps4 family AAA+-type ATPase